MPNLHGSPRSAKQKAAFKKLIETLKNKTPEQKAAIAAKKKHTRALNDAKCVRDYIYQDDIFKE